MAEKKILAAQFQTHRARLQAVAYRMLGSQPEAEDAVQEAWLRLERQGNDGVDNLGGWLTTVVARVCLDLLRSRKSRREDPLDDELPEPSPSGAEGTDPEYAMALSDSVGLALLIVLSTLSPAERLAFVLHDMFALPFDEIARIGGVTPIAARQLASRARRRVASAAKVPDADLVRQREVVGAFFAASRAGDLTALLKLLDENAVVRADPTVIKFGATAEVRGAAEVAKQFLGRAQAAQLALVDGAIGAVWAPKGRVRVVFSFAIADGKILGFDLLADPARLSELDVAILPD